METLVYARANSGVRMGRLAAGALLLVGPTMITLVWLLRGGKWPFDPGTMGIQYYKFVFSPLMTISAGLTMGAVWLLSGALERRAGGHAGKRIAVIALAGAYLLVTCARCGVVVWMMHEAEIGSLLTVTLSRLQRVLQYVANFIEAGLLIVGVMYLLEVGRRTERRWVGTLGFVCLGYLFLATLLDPVHDLVLWIFNWQLENVEDWGWIALGFPRWGSITASLLLWLTIGMWAIARERALHGNVE